MISFYSIILVALLRNYNMNEIYLSFGIVMLNFTAFKKYLVCYNQQSRRIKHERYYFSRG